MRVHAYFCEYEDQHEYNGDLINGCITYPVEITNEHAASSYGQYLVMICGEPRGPGDMPPGELQIPEAFYEELAPKLVAQGYEVCPAPVNDTWLESWRKGMPVKH